MSGQPYSVVIQVTDDHIDRTVLPAGIDIRNASNGRTELIMRIVADDPVDAISQAEYLIDSQPLTLATVRVVPRREFQPDDEGPLPVLVTVPEAAVRLGVSQQRIRQLIAEPNGLHAAKPGRDWLLRESDILRRKERMAARMQAADA